MSTKKHTGSWFFMSVLIRIDYVNPAAAVKQVSSTEFHFHIRPFGHILRIIVSDVTTCSQPFVGHEKCS